MTTFDSATSDSVFDDVVDPDSVTAFEDMTSNWLPFLHWLNLRHDDRDDEFWDLAHLVLSGGPDALWVNRFDLTPVMVYEDVQLLYASGRASVTSKHVDQAREAKRVYYETAPKVADLAHRRKAREDRYSAPNHDGSASVTAAMRTAYDERNLSLPQNSNGSLVPRVTDEHGHDLVPSSDDLPQLKMSFQCAHILNSGKRCQNRILQDNEFCSHHGGRLYTEEELRNIHQVTKQKLLGAAEQAVDNLTSLLNSTNDMVRLKASEAILDRTGFVPGMEVTVIASPEGDKTPAQIIHDRLQRLAAEPPEVTQVTGDDASDPPDSSPDDPPDDGDTIDADIVDDPPDDVQSESASSSEELEGP